MIRRQPFEVRVDGQPNAALPPALPVAIPAAAPAAIPAANAVNQNPQPPRPPSASPSQQQLAGEFKIIANTFTWSEKRTQRFWSYNNTTKHKRKKNDNVLKELAKKAAKEFEEVANKAKEEKFEEFSLFVSQDRTLYKF